MNRALTLPPERVEHVARYARGALIAAGAVGVVPTPLDAVRQALDLHDPEDLLYLDDAPPGLLKRIRMLAGKVLGALDVRERVVLIDRTQSHERQRFALGHELGHAGLPWHHDAYFADDHRTLDPDTHSELEAEANSFSADILFNQREFGDRAHSTALGLAAAIEMADVFETSRQSAIRRYVEDSPRPCALLVLGRFLVHPQGQPSMKVLRAVDSGPFRREFGPASALFPAAFPIGEGLLGGSARTALRGSLAEPITTGDHVLLDSARGAQTLKYEVFSNTYAVFVLLYPKQHHGLGKRVRLAWTPEEADTA